MRWKKTQIGDSRWRKNFCLLPRPVGNQMIWLESIWVYEVYCNSLRGDYWSEIKAVTLEEMKAMYKEAKDSTASNIKVV